MPSPAKIWLEYQAYAMGAISRGTTPLSPAEWLMKAFPDRYQNRASAASQMRKFRSGERSGEKLEYYADRTTIGPSHKIVPDESGEHYRFERDPYMVRKRRPGGILVGMWKVIIWFRWLGPGEEWVYEERSFTMFSEEFENAFDIPELEERLAPIVEYKIQQWVESGSIPPVYEVLKTAVISINRTGLQDDQILNLDDWDY